MKIFTLLLSMFLLSACDRFTAGDYAPGEIPVKFVDIQKTKDCGYEVEVDHTMWAINYLAFYLSDPQIKVEGKWVSLNFIPNDWQSEDVALLTFDNACQTSTDGTFVKLDANEKLLKRATELRFTMGLNFDDNHSKPVEQAVPLSQSAMYQNPQSGHSFFRLELQQERDPNHNWSFLLASGGCKSDSRDLKPTECQYPNRVTVSLPMAQNVSNLHLLGHLQQVLFRADLTTKECNLAKPHDKKCEKVLRNLTERHWLKWDAPDKVYLKS